MKKNDIITIIKIFDFLLLGLYLLIYIVPLGAYRADINPYYGSDFLFDEYRLRIVAQTGLLFTFVVASLCVIKNLKYKKIRILIIFFALLQMVHACNCINLFLNLYKIIDKSEKIELFISIIQLLGLIIFSIVVILNLAVMVLTIAEIKGFKLDKNIAHRKKESDVNLKNRLFRKAIVSLNYIMSIVLIVMFFGAISIALKYGLVWQEALQILIGFIIPICIISAVFFSKWIINGKWVWVCVGYVILAYEIYVMCFYTLYKYIFFELTNVFEINKIRLFICGFCCILCFFAVEMLICRIVENRIVK